MRSPLFTLFLLLLVLVGCCILSVAASSSDAVSVSASASESALELDRLNSLSTDTHHTQAELEWSKHSQHTPVERASFITAYELAAAVAESLDATYHASLNTPGVSSNLAMDSNKAEAVASEEMNDWNDEAAVSQHSFAEIAALHSLESEHQLLNSLSADEVDFDRAQGAALNTAATDGAIDAGIAAAFQSFLSTRQNVHSTASATTTQSSDALTDAARNYVISKIPPEKILERAMAGTLGEMVRQHGPKYLETPAAKLLLSKAQQELAISVLQSPLAHKLVAKVQTSAGELLSQGSPALGFVDAKIAQKTGVGLPLGKAVTDKLAAEAAAKAYAADPRTIAMMKAEEKKAAQAATLKKRQDAAAKKLALQESRKASNRAAAAHKAALKKKMLAAMKQAHIDKVAAARAARAKAKNPIKKQEEKPKLKKKKKLTKKKPKNKMKKRRIRKPIHKKKKKQPLKKKKLPLKKKLNKKKGKGGKSARKLKKKLQIVPIPTPTPPPTPPPPPPVVLPPQPELTFNDISKQYHENFDEFTGTVNGHVFQSPEAKAAFIKHTASLPNLW